MLSSVLSWKRNMHFASCHKKYQLTFLRWWFVTGSTEIFQYFRRFHVWAGVIHGHQWVSSTIWDLKDELNMSFIVPTSKCRLKDLNNYIDQLGFMRDFNIKNHVGISKLETSTMTGNMIMFTVFNFRNCIPVFMGI